MIVQEPPPILMCHRDSLLTAPNCQKQTTEIFSTVLSRAIFCNPQYSR